MKAAVLRGIKDLSIEDIEKPVIKKGEALVRIRAVGVCGSDVHYYLHGRIGDQVMKGGHILGHEVAGEVAEVSDGVTNVKPGDRVAVEPGIPCGECEHCRSGRYNICPGIIFFGTPPNMGAYKEFAAWPAERLFPIPDSMSYAEGTLIETLAVGMYAASMPKSVRGCDAAVLGCGPVGLVTIKSLLALGVKRIFATDLIDNRLETARKQGNVLTVNASKKDPVGVIMKETGGRGVDLVFEAAGALDTYKQTVEAARIGGEAMWIGIPPEDYVSVEAHRLRRKELVIRAVRRFRDMYPKCIDAVKNGSIVLKDLVTHEFTLDEIEKPFKLVETYSDGIIKAIINI